jgi:NAD(P)H-hydrate epimerase
MAHAVDAPEDLGALCEWASVLLLGPGLGTGAWSEALFERVLDAGRPRVLDADGLNLLARNPRRLPDDWVLTPHPGEAARLLQTCVAEIQSDRFGAADALRRRYGCWVVLKGGGTLVVGPGSRPPAVCSDGNPGMASGGMGDVLGGVIAAFMAQGWSAGEAAELGVCLHAAAGDRAADAAGERGMLASDLMPYLRRLGNPR